MHPALRRALPALIASALILGALAFPTVAGRPSVPVPGEAAIRAAGGRLVAIDREGGRTRFVPVRAERGREAATAQGLASLPGVDAVVVDRTVSIDAWPDQGDPNDPYFAAYQGGFAQLDIQTAWHTTRGAGATIAVLDTGANLNHPDFAGLHVVGTYNAFDGTSNVADGHGHGTHVLGTVAATANNGVGVAGVAPDVDILVVKVLADSGSGSFSALANGIEWAIAHGADVITMSLGASGTADMFSGFAYAADDAWHAGVVLTAAAGNTGDKGLHFPSCWNHVISVGSVGGSGARSSFSTYNACTDVAAPGESIVSTSSGGGYVQMSGTSMATPHVAGVLGLLRAAAPSQGPGAIETALEATAQDKGAVGRDDEYGHGIVRAGSALDVALGGQPPATPPPAPTPAPYPAKVLSATASPATISYDANGYCPASAKVGTVTAATAPASAGVSAATAVTLNWKRPGSAATETRAMTRGVSTSAGTAWSTTLDTASLGLSAAGALTYWVTATNAGGTATRYPAGTVTNRINVAVCANVAPAIGAPLAERTVIVTNPLGTGTVPAGLSFSTQISATVADTDGVASATLTVAGGGLTTPVALPMARSGGAWAATVDTRTVTIPGGTVTTSLTVRDALGKSATRSGPAITVIRADTPGAAEVTAIEGAADNRAVVRITADDADATWIRASSTLGVKVRWTATYTNAAGAAVTTPWADAVARYAGGRSWTAALPTTWLTTAVSNVRITAFPVATDPYRNATTGTTVAETVVARGAPTVIASSASATAVVTDPLGTGNRAAHGLPDAVTFTARAADTDAVASVVVAWSAPGVTGTRTLPMSLANGAWTATLDPTAAGITGTGRIAWAVHATDELGLVGKGAAGSVNVTRADTAGSASVVAAVTDPTGATTVTLEADDPDATFSGTTTSLRVTLAWSASYVTGGVPRTTTMVTATTTYRGGRTFTAKLATASWMPAAGSGTFTLRPTATDPFGKATVGTPRTLGVSKAS